MKYIIVLFFVFFTQLVFSQDINGVYQDSSSSALKNCYAVFATKNDSVFMTHYLEFNGEPFVEYGSGIVKGNTLIYEVVVSKTIPGWSTAGRHVLQVEEKGKVLRGFYKDNLGNEGILVFKQLFPQ